ncbi:MAG TPA: molybdopterin-dependent oxidoreductase, partial [Candidatus Glassbacteria bacterium]|nr:molybdopterin-dependent oxidoreductase [Candidatus Glassbacteria bacterium]
LTPILLLACLPLSCGGGGGSDHLNPETREPGTGELSEYNGIKLFSTIELRENSIKGPQKIDMTQWRLEITGLVNNPRSYTYEELRDRPTLKRVIWLHCVDGWSAKLLWEGFKLRDLLDEAGIQNTATHAKFYGYDGFKNWLSLNFIQVQDVMVATNANGLPLRVDRGYPLQVISEGKYGYKWCKWLVKIELTNNVENFGDYENSGYPVDGVVGSSYYKPIEY